jgi:cytosine/adenosine deaminase-related metal-dependent hydrolase
LADLALLDLHALAFTPLTDVPGQLVYCQNGGDVTLTMVDGRIVAEHGRLTTVDEDALLAEAREVFAAKAPALADARRDAARWFPEYQRMVRRAAATDVGMRR